MYSHSRFRQISRVTLAALLAAATLALAWPRLLASVRFLPVEHAAERYYAERQIPSQRLLTLAGFAEESLGLSEHHRYGEGLALLQYLRGLDVQTPALERRAAYRAAEAAALEAVRRAPARPETWLRIATVRAILRDEPGEVLGPWRMSVFTGRTHSTLVAPRVGIALPWMEFMDAETRSMLRDQLLLAWSLKPRELLSQLKAYDPRLLRTRELIGGTEPAALSEMEAKLEAIR